MMRMRTKSNGLPQMNGGLADGRGEAGEKAWELRPGGMLVQKRTEEDQNHVPPPPIRVRVKYGSAYHEIYINSRASFGELKKMLTGPTGLHHQDQKLFYKDKERNSNAFLDSAVSEISLEVDRLAAKVSALETVVSKGGKVVEKDVVDLIELLMNQLLKLDGIAADGDVKLQRKIQVRRVQKHVELLDALKMKNSATTNHIVTPTQQNQPQQANMNSKANITSSVQSQQLPRHSFGSSSTDSPKHNQDQPSRQSSSTAAVVITTQWETFDSTPAPIPAGHPSISTVGTKTSRPVQPNFTWDLL
ncbi:BAG family molecular chaperone regulator 1 [Dorcoceras hygrometricum]|uniref:BAG family molecular chaperone regulator 1 n=1 Tax=Dorcoceras hygrometricum TaxID=472368 RepID=A0A2Z7C2A3_9LAMI|nr:BAG family molecular chaperone regulator 1 [Dorcoceras hygrometricum]